MGNGEEWEWGMGNGEMKLNRYPKYKPTGIAWLPELPEGWEVKKVRQLAREGKTKNKGNVEKNVLSLSYGHIIRKKEVYSGLVPTDFATYQIVEKDYVVLRLTDLQNDHKSLRCGLVCERGIITSAYVSLVPQNVLPAYLYLALHTCDLNKVFYSMGGGLRQSMNFADVGNLFVPLPPLPTQRVIVAFLDGKCGKIDRWVAAKEREVALLKELKQAMIAEAVTGATNVARTDTARKMKPSGIPWLPEVPEGWEVRRLVSLFSNGVKSNKDFVYSRALKFNYGTLIPKNELGDPEEYRDVYVKYSLLQKGDIVINGLNLNYDFNSMRVACAPCDGIITSAYIVCRPRLGIDTSYFTYLFKAMDYQKMFHGMGTGIRLTLSFNELRGQFLPVPPLAEQREIVAYLDEKCGKIDAAVAGLEREVAAMKEYKQRLIADVVTGQRKVA